MDRSHCGRIAVHYKNHTHLLLVIFSLSVSKKKLSYCDCKIVIVVQDKGHNSERNLLLFIYFKKTTQDISVTTIIYDLYFLKKIQDFLTMCHLLCLVLHIGC